MIGFWTPDRVEELTWYQAAGLSASQIADVLGCTRNAVIGKLHRMGIAGIPESRKKELQDELERECG